MHSLLKGALAGAAATLPMTLVMILTQRSSPRTRHMPLPPWIVAATIAERLGLWQHLPQPQRNTYVLAAHTAYGAAAGATYAALAPRSAQKSLPTTLTAGLAFGTAVWAGSYAGWLPAAHIVPPPTHQPPGLNVTLLSSHFLFGTTLAVLHRQFTLKA